MSSSSPLREADILFPTAHTSIHKTLGELKRSNLTIKNRLRSIAHDADFVQSIKCLGLPFIANERCGSWYIDPKVKQGSAYFKSTDGHFGQWSFNLRRLNLHLLDIIAETDGCIIVDSTRRGKSMPDALSKTVPIWITVLNRLLFPEDSEACVLQTPLDVVSESEHAQIAAKIDSFAQQAIGLQLDIATLRTKLCRPMRAYWLNPDSKPEELELIDHFRPVVLCTASSRVSGSRVEDSDYVQGAADDQESWACGLTPAVFWSASELLLEAAEDELPDLIRSLLVARPQLSQTARAMVKPTSQVFVVSSDGVSDQYGAGDVVIHCSANSNLDLLKSVTQVKARYIHLACAEGKLGSRLLRHELVKIDDLSRELQQGRNVVCVCESGQDLSIGVALAMICRFFDDDGRCRDAPHTPGKDEIKRRLAWITLSIPSASPSRATLQSVNAYLMS